MNRCNLFATALSLRSDRSFDTDAQVLSCASRTRLPDAGQLQRESSP
jgi:hypothetical protein